MAQRRHHYERAFEAFLRDRRVPYIAVDEARKALLPEGAVLRATDEEGRSLALKSFDFVAYGNVSNLLLEVKGRRVAERRPRRTSGDGAAAGAITREPGEPRAPARLRTDAWVTLDDLSALRAWRSLFGSGFEAAFVFVFWCESQPPDGLFQEVFEFQSRWYAVRAVLVDAYAGAMRVRSPKWGTVYLGSADFERLSQPFTPPGTPRGPEGGLGGLGSAGLGSAGLGEGALVDRLLESLRGPGGRVVGA